MSTAVSTSANALTGAAPTANAVAAARTIAYPPLQPYVDTTLHARLKGIVDAMPERVATVFYGATLSYGALWREIDALARYLRVRFGVGLATHNADSADVTPARVVIDMQNCPQFVIAYYATLLAGGIVVPISPMNTAAEIVRLVAHSGARVACVGGELAARFASVLPELDGLIIANYRDYIAADTDLALPSVLTVVPDSLPSDARLIQWAEAIASGSASDNADGGVDAPSIETTPDDSAVLIYTSGTTGVAKGCLHTHRSTLFTARAQADWYGIDGASVVTAFMPLFHVAGMQGSMNAGLSSGATLVLMARWDRDIVPTLFERHCVTFWNAPPTMVVDVLASDGFSEATFATLRTLTGGGAPMPPAIAEQLLERFGLTFIEGYGMSETMSPTHINPPGACRAGSIGVPIYDTFSLIIDPEKGGPLAPGDIGEIVVSGPQVLTGYWHNPEADAAAFLVIDGRRYLRTGDLGRIDDDGYFVLVDRIKRMINCSGFKVWPAELETILYRHEAVQECCVIAVPDPYRGEAVRALIVRRAARDGQPLAASESGIRDWLRGLVATYKVPRDVCFVDVMPRSASNKIDWRQLQDAARQEGSITAAQPSKATP